MVIKVCESTDIFFKVCIISPTEWFIRSNENSNKNVET